MAQVEVIKSQFVAACVAMNEAEEENGVLPLEEMDFTLKWFSDSIYDQQITPEGRKATVIYRDAICPNFGSGYCGSGGCRRALQVLVPTRAMNSFAGTKPQRISCPLEMHSYVSNDS